MKILSIKTSFKIDLTLMNKMSENSHYLPLDYIITTYLSI